MAAPESEPIEVHVVEAHPLYRTALVHALENTADMCPGVAAPSVEEFASRRPDPGRVVTLELKLPGVCDMQAVSAVVRMGFAVIVLSGQGDADDVRAAMAVGARGYLTKEADVAEIRHAVRIVSAGGRYLSPRLATSLREATRCQVVHRLTDRERQVLTLLANGGRDQDIAHELSISIRTVRSHLDRIREKTGRRRRSDLTRLALEKGFAS